MPTPDDPLPPDPWSFPLDEHKKPGNENERAINWEPLIVLVLTGLFVWFVIVPGVQWFRANIF